MQLKFNDFKYVYTWLAFIGSTVRILSSVFFWSSDNSWYANLMEAAAWASSSILGLELVVFSSSTAFWRPKSASSASRSISAKSFLTFWAPRPPVFLAPS